MRRIAGYLGAHKVRLIWGGLMLLLTNAAAMGIPQLFRRAVDAIRGGADADTLQGLALGLVVLAACGALFRTLSRIHIFYTARDVEMDVRSDLYRHLSGLEPDYFHRNPPGELMSRATGDMTQVRMMLGPGALNAANTVIAYAFAIPLMAMISVELTLLTLAIYPPALLLIRWVARRLYQRNFAQRQAMGELSNFSQENLSGMHVIRAFNREAQREARFASLNDNYYRESVRLARARAGMQRLVTAVGSLGVLLAIYFGARSALSGAVTVGELVALGEYMALLSWPTFAMGWVLTMWQRGLAAAERIDELFGAQPRIHSGAARPASLEPRIRVDALDLELGGRRALDTVSLEVKPGQTLGLVGPIGGGKTVLLQALMRLVEVPRGAIWLGGYDVTQLELAQLRAQFGYVPQQHVLFSRSLAENVAFGRPGASHRAVEDALAAAAFRLDAQAFPEGLQTPVGERGITLSGGQKQRVSIARATLLQPPILLLDDALSSVDAQTEQRILDALTEQRSGRTTIIVAHRVSAVEHADEIVVLDGGKVSERGRHADLMRRDGWYACMARRQQGQQTTTHARRHTELVDAP